jgi:hypothetical protein
MLGAEITRVKALLDAAESYSKDSYDLETDYAKKQFETNKKITLAVLDAAIAQMVGLSELDSYFARKTADEYGAITVDDDFWAVKSQIDYDNYLAANLQRQEINDVKTATDKTNKRQSRRDSNNNFTDYFEALLALQTTYEIAIATADAEYYNIVTTAETDFDETVWNAAIDYAISYINLSEQYDTTLDIIDHDGDISTNSLSFSQSMSASNNSQNGNGGYDPNSGYWENVLKTAKGMVWTGPKRLVVGTFNTVTHPIQSAQNAYWGTGEAIYGISAGTYNLGQAFYNDPGQAASNLANSTWNSAWAGIDYGLDNPEEVGVGYFNVSATVVTAYSGGMIADKIKYTRNRTLLENIAIRADHKFPDTGHVVGTHKHKYAEDLLNKYQSIYVDRNLHTEVRYVNREVWVRGESTKGSIRIDVVEGNENKPTRFYDYKFGSATLTDNRIIQIKNVSGKPNIPIIEIKPK